jgi:parallel beta-helix repeat protein
VKYNHAAEASPFYGKVRILHFLMLFLACGVWSPAKDISGIISSTLTLTDNSRLVGDVTCTVNGAPCITINAPGIVLDLNGYTMTGLGDPQTGCSGSNVANEIGIFVNAQPNVTIQGLGIVQQFRNSGILVNNSAGVTVTGLTTSTNCNSGILVGGGSTDNLIENNISIRNGNLTSPCGGICLAGAIRARVRGNRLSGNGYSAQLANFGVGLPSPADTGNVIEQNTISGNTNGIFIAPGVQGNIFRLNLITGNPALQVGLDHPFPGTSGVDVLNLSTTGANAFVGNECLTSVGAPCPGGGPIFTATPNPIPVATGVTDGQTTLSWSAPGSQVIEIHVGSMDGPLFTAEGNRGSLQTGPWVSDGTVFYLQDVSGGKPLTADYTLATVTVHLQPASSAIAALVGLGGGPRGWTGAMGATVLLLGLLLWRGRGNGRRRWLTLGGAAAIVLTASLAHGQSQPTPQQTAVTLDKMMAAHKSQQEMAQYVFSTHGCQKCHTAGSDGKLGFTDRGKQAAGKFEGCIRMLTDMTVIAQMSELRRSEAQKQKAARFEEFGCTFCHQIAPGKLQLTEVGTKLTHLHLGCVDVEKQLASSKSK